MFAWFQAATATVKVVLIASTVSVASAAVVVPLALTSNSYVDARDRPNSSPSSSQSTALTPTPSVSSTSPAEVPPLSGVGPEAGDSFETAPDGTTTAPGTPSTPGNPSATQAVSSAPEGLTLTGSAGNWADVAWTSPSSPGTQPIAGYALFTSVDDGVRWSLAGTVLPEQLTYRFSTLEQSTRYAFAAQALTNAGASPYSNALTHTTSLYPPAAPENLLMGGRSCDGQSCGGGVSFTAPANSSGGTLSYEVGYSTDGGLTWTFVSATPDPGAPGYFQFATANVTLDPENGLLIVVRASTEFGVGAPSASVRF